MQLLKQKLTREGYCQRHKQQDMQARNQYELRTNRLFAGFVAKPLLGDYRPRGSTNKCQHQQ